MKVWHRTFVIKCHFSIFSKYPRCGITREFGKRRSNPGFLGRVKTGTCITLIPHVYPAGQRWACSGGAHLTAYRTLRAVVLCHCYQPRWSSFWVCASSCSLLLGTPSHWLVAQMVFHCPLLPLPTRPIVFAPYLNIRFAHLSAIARTLSEAQIVVTTFSGPARTPFPWPWQI